MDNEKILKEFFTIIIKLPKEKYVMYKEQVLKSVHNETRVLLDQIFKVVEKKER